jgi:hypothetical protein
MFDGRGFEAICAGDPLADTWADDFPDRDEPSWMRDYALNDELDVLVGSPRQRLEAILGRRPCGRTMSALEELAQQPMTEGEKVLFAKAWQRQADAAAGTAVAALGDALGPEPDAGEPDLIATECGLALRVSPDAVFEKARFARRMATTLSATLERWCAGVASTGHARIVDELTRDLADQQASVIDKQLAVKAGTVSTKWFRLLARREVAKRDTPTATERHRKAAERRSAFLDHEDDGMTVLGLRCTAIEGVAAMQALNGRADAARLPGDTRTHGERQADVLLDLLLGAPITGPGGIRRRNRAEIQVGVTLPTLLGLRDDPGHLHGYGPIPAGMVRDLLGEEGTTLRRLIIDPVDGRLIDYGRARYRPDARLTAVVRARDRTCRFPDCPRPGEWCDIDHSHEWDSGGETSERNCHLLCRRHHRLKTFTRFRYAVDESTGTVTWTTPLGFTYTSPPGSYPELVDT